MNCRICGGEVHCKGLCRKCYDKDYHHKNRRVSKEKQRLYYLKNKANLIKQVAEWRLKNPDARKKEYQRNKEKIKERARTWYYNNKERVITRNRNWRHRNIERNRKLQKKYDDKNKQKTKERGRIYRLNNKEKIKLRNYLYKLNNPEKCRMLSRKKKFKRRVILKGLKYSLEIPVESQKKIIERDKVCVYCNCETFVKGDKGYTITNRQTIDHIIAVENRGTNNFNNLVLSCNKCNSSKSNNDVFEWCKSKNVRVPDIVIKLLNKQKEQKRICDIR